MDSPSIQQATIQPGRDRSHTSFSTQSTVNNRGAIQKRSHDSNRTISVSQAEKLYQFAADQQNQLDLEHPTIPTSTAGGIQWITPQHSPQPQSYQPESSLEPFPQWTAPTPPHSDSGILSISVDASDDPVTTGISVTPEFAFEEPAAEMSSLGFLLPTAYGSTHYESDSRSMSFLYATGPFFF